MSDPSSNSPTREDFKKIFSLPLTEKEREGFAVLWDVFVPSYPISKGEALIFAIQDIMERMEDLP